MKLRYTGDYPTVVMIKVPTYFITAVKPNEVIDVPNQLAGHLIAAHALVPVVEEVKTKRRVNFQAKGV